MGKSHWSHPTADRIKEDRIKLLEMSSFEIKARKDGFNNIGGIDEVGRGPLAGPVVTACVIMPEKFDILGIDDSKKLTAEKREYLSYKIKESAISWAIGIIDEKIIDEINILNATKTAMLNAIENMHVKPDLVLTDAVKLETDIRQITIIRGDCLSVSIAAASIIAKVERDRMMVEIDSKYPEYGFLRHKGYGTPEHIKAIRKHGLCPIHRLSFTKNFIV